MFLDNTPGEEGMSLSDMKKRNMFVWAIVALMSVIGIWLFCKEIVSETADNVGRIETATMLWIAAIAIYRMCSVDTRYYIEKNKEAGSEEGKKIR